MTKKILLALTFVSMINVVNQDFAADRPLQSVTTAHSSQSNTPSGNDSDRRNTKIGLSATVGVVTTIGAIGIGLVFGPIGAAAVVFMGLLFLGSIILG
jgi:hypothetical protein